jgi:hypothetical protein
MTAGFSNLASLKSFLLARSLQADTDYDAKIQAIGLGAASLIDQHCNRHFAYLANDMEIFTGDRPAYYLTRYPIATNPDGTPQIAQINMRYFMTDAWTNIEGEPIQVNPQTGLVSFGYTLGRAPLQVQIIWTGGFWFPVLDSGEPNYPDTLPAGATPIPNDLVAAWQFQCAELWNKLDVLGTGISADPDKVAKPGDLRLVPLVETMLAKYVRYQLT